MSLHRVDQGMAARASAILSGQEVSKELRTRMRQLPSRLRGSGLAATYAFLMARAARDDPVAAAYRKLTEEIARHADERRLLDDRELGLTPQEFLKRFSALDSESYLRLTAEIDALAVWLSRLATALYEENPARGGAENGTDRSEQLPGER